MDCTHRQRVFFKTYYRYEHQLESATGERELEFCVQISHRADRLLKPCISTPNNATKPSQALSTVV